MKIITTIRGSLLALALAGMAHAGTVGNGAPNQSGGSDLNGYLEADNFSLSDAIYLTAVQYWTLQNDSTDYSGDTVWEIYQDASGLPGSLTASGDTAATGTATGKTTYGLAEYSCSFTINVPLAAGNYWLGLHNGSNSGIPSTSFYWAWSAGTGNSQSQDLSVTSSAWATNSAELAFLLTTAPTPEPTSFALIGCGLLTAWFSRRRFTGKV